MVDWGKLLLVLGAGAAVATITFISGIVAIGVLYVAYEAFIYLSQPIPPAYRMYVGMWLVIFSLTSFVIGVHAYTGNFPSGNDE